MTHPTVDFVLNERCIELDVFYTLMFFRNPDKSGDFSKKTRIIKQYPQFTAFDSVEVSSQDLFVKQEVNKIHSELHAVLTNTLETTESLWREIEKTYFDLVATVFPEFPWPEGNYKCYMSVIDINAIIKKEKSFQLFYGMVSKNITNSVIAHEMLHFIFYSYMENYPNIEKAKLWEMAEIFNKFIQNTQKFKNFNYPEDKVLEEKQEIILKDIKVNLNPETVNIQDFVSYYQTHYLS